MKELEKVRKVIDKRIPGAPHECLLVIDATTGQNGLNQAKHFSEAAGCTGIVLAKLDGTAKGGVIVAIRQQMGIPVKYVGVGEQIDDLQLFDPDEFVDALFDGRVIGRSVTENEMKLWDVESFHFPQFSVLWHFTRTVTRAFCVR